jgi:hypothetical protein
LGFGVWGLGFGVWGLGFGVWSFVFGLWLQLLIFAFGFNAVFAFDLQLFPSPPLPPNPKRPNKKPRE